MDLWRVSTDEFEQDLVPHYGNKFLSGNGYFGIRGTMEEAEKAQLPAINMAGIYDGVPGKWRENVNAPNPLYTKVSVNGEVLSLYEKAPLSHRQSLNFYEAIHSRSTTWQLSGGTVTVSAERFASMANQHLIGLSFSVSADFDCEITLTTGIDGDVWDINGPHFAAMTVSPDKVSGTTGEKSVTVSTCQTVSADFHATVSKEETENRSLTHFVISAKAGQSYTVKKLAAVTSSVDEHPMTEDLASLSYETEKAAHLLAWENIWTQSAVEIEGDDEAMHALNYSLYHLNCIAPRNLSGLSIPARGLSGQVYKGAIFWDTEMFMMDYYLYSEPEIAKSLIQYRVESLPGAREKAAQYGLPGAYYAWESQEKGFEACSDYNVVDVFTGRPMRTYFRDKQYHVSAAVVYGITKYLDVTGDLSILSQGAMEVILECAMMYRGLLLKGVDSDEYQIRDVVGPDEYHERVSNNAYTNRMAQHVFATASELICRIRTELPETYAALSGTYDLDGLQEKFADASAHIKLQKPDEKGIIPQFDGYFDLEDCSVDTVRSRLLNPKEYWGGAYGVASDTQVLKQADVLAMMSIFPEDYSKEIMAKNWDYYEPRTEHGSSLSACMYALSACHIGRVDYAYPLFLKSASSDLRPGGKEWAGLVYIGGTHPAAEGGAWIVAIKGFAGLSIKKDGQLGLAPKLPSHWQSMKFNLRYRGKNYRVEIDQTQSRITAQ